MPAELRFHLRESTTRSKYCRGVLHAHDSIYVAATNSQGFYRLQDTSGDGTFDKEELLLPLNTKVDSATE